MKALVDIGHGAARLRRRVDVEWPTLALALVIYGGWLAATYWYAAIPTPLRIAAGGWLIAWHGSLQHEVIHGHPTRSRWLNTALAAWPLALWLPYPLYRQAHLRHHATEALTFPGQDPEACYRACPRGRLARVTLGLAVLESTLLGRLTLGPLLLVGRFGLAEVSAVLRAPGRLKVWAWHMVLVALILSWVLAVCHMSILEYLLVFIYPGIALGLLRSFAEHRAHPDPRRRVAVVERSPVLGLLFLHNNLHALHHARPSLAWYRLPAAYAAVRAKLLEANGGLAYAGYGEVFARYLLRPHDRVIHPALAAGDTP